MNSPASIIAIGGGGFTHETDPELDRYLLDKCPARTPRIGFVGTASGDDPVKIDRFYARFAREPCRASHMAPFERLENAANWIAAQDIIYVGGGNTGSLIELWTEWRLPRLFRAAAEKGTVLAGVSAGAVCWFDFVLSDSAGPSLAPLECLGFMAGSCCPHYSTEPARRPAFEQMIGTGELPGGIAIDDGVAVHFENGEPVDVLSSRPGAGAYLVGRTDASFTSTRLESRR